MAWIINTKTNMKWEIEEGEVIAHLLQQEDYEEIAEPVRKKTTKAEKGR